MTSFHEHLAAEQRKNQARLRGMITLFVVLFAVFLIVPVYMGRVFLEQSRVNLEAQKAAQDNLAQALSQSMGSLAEAAHELRDELARQREMNGGAAAPVQAYTPRPVVKETPPAPPEPTPVEAKPTKKKMTRAEEYAPTRIEQPVPVAPVEVKTVETAEPQPPPEPVELLLPQEPINTQAAQGDLETLLKQVEQAITEKEKELKMPKK
jgi:cell division protein FtsB